MRPFERRIIPDVRLQLSRCLGADFKRGEYFVEEACELGLAAFRVVACKSFERTRCRLPRASCAMLDARVGSVARRNSRLSDSACHLANVVDEQQGMRRTVIDGLIAASESRCIFRISVPTASRRL